LARLFFWSILAGAALAVLALLLLPLPGHQRVRSNISVLNNGGRAESFTIQWPRDRIEMPASRDPGLVSAGPAIELRANAGGRAAVEVFRVRDANGTVVGVASRTISRGASGGQLRDGSDWILLIPSRGALFMTELNAFDLWPRAQGGGDPTIAPATDLRSTWGTARHLQVTAGPVADGRGRVLRGTEEFSGLTGVFTETWDLDAGAPAAPISGHITLATELRAEAR
jgi:hypothetical protein